MRQILKMAADDGIPTARFFSTGQVAQALGVGRGVAIRLIDRRQICGFRLPGVRRDRRVTDQALADYLRRFRGAEPPVPPACPVRCAFPQSAHRPRTVKGGKITNKCTYSASEIAFVLGLARRTVIGKLEAGIIQAIRVPATGLTAWTWRIPHGCLEKFLRDNPAYSYGWDRIRDFESGNGVNSQR
jgi:hypothetical protein